MGMKATAVAPNTRCIVRRITTSVKLNNNFLDRFVGLSDTLALAVNNPLISLQWIDLSFNRLVTVEPELLRFVNLKALYLHGNIIKSMEAVQRLKGLPKLLSLTLNENPIQSMQSYRFFVIGALQHLRSLDHLHVT